MNEETAEPQTEAQTKIKPSTVADATFSVADPLLFKSLCEAIDGLLSDVTFQFEDYKLIIRGMDPSRVAMLEYNIDMNRFETWEVTMAGYATFDMTEVLKIVFSMVKKDTNVKVTVDPNREKIIFTLTDSRTRIREFPLLQTHETPELIPTPKLMYNTHFKVRSKAWQEDLKDLAKSSDHVKIHVESGFVKVTAPGDCKAENKYEVHSFLKNGLDVVTEIEAQEPSHATYSLSYLATGFSFFNPELCDVATIEMSTDMPLRATLHTKFGDLYNYLAPRIEIE